MCLSIRLSFFSFFFFKQKPAYELRISDWSSDVCSSDLVSLLVDEAALQAMMERARARGVECRGIADHGFIRSIYLRDPNGYVVELAAKTDRHNIVLNPARNGTRAVLAEWQASKLALSPAG